MMTMSAVSTLVHGSSLHRLRAECSRFGGSGGISLHSRVLDHRRELVGIEARPTHEGAVDVGLGHQLGDVGRLHRPAVLDAHTVPGSVADALANGRAG